jgi:hypothetical protein
VPPNRKRVLRQSSDYDVTSTEPPQNRKRMSYSDDDDDDTVPEPWAKRATRD